MRSNITYDVVPDELAGSLRETTPDRRGWVKPLEDGKMLRMSKRPQWVKMDRLRTGLKLKTRIAGDDTTDVFVWLVRDETLPAHGSTEQELVDQLNGR